jgi:hypothetical protein
MLSDDVRCLLNTFTNIIRPAIERECDRKVLAAARVFERNLADLVETAAEWEATVGPDAVARLTAADQPQKVVRLTPKAARDVAPGQPWTFPHHRSLGEVMAASDPSDGGDAA